MYALSKFTDSIKQIDNLEKFKKTVGFQYGFCEIYETYEDARKGCVDRTKHRIEQLEKEIKKLKKKLPKIESMTEQPNKKAFTNNLK